MLTIIIRIDFHQLLETRGKMLTCLYSEFSIKL